MGIDLVQLALLHHAPRLSGRAFKVLCKMAATALDTPNGRGQPALLYFAGEGPLAHVLYGRGPDFEAYSDNELREVRRMLKELRDAQLIQPLVDKARRGRAQSFRLTLGGQIAPSVEGQIPHPNPGEHAHPKQGEIAPDGVGDLPTPRTHRGLTEDLPQDSITHPSTSTTGREAAPPGWTCRHCGHPKRPAMPCDTCGSVKGLMPKGAA